MEQRSGTLFVRVLFGCQLRDPGGLLFGIEFARSLGRELLEDQLGVADDSNLDSTVVADLLAIQINVDKFRIRRKTGCTQEREHGIGARTDYQHDIRFAQHIDPPLTTIAQPMREIGEGTVRLLLEILNGGGEAAAPESVTLPHSLVVRASTAPPRTHPSNKATAELAESAE